MIPITRKVAASLAALTLAFAASGCGTDDAVEKDVDNAVEDVQNSDVGKAAEDATNDVGDAIKGDGK